MSALSASPIHPVLTHLAAAETRWPAGRRRVIALDGKTVRGSANDAADARHLLAAIDHRSAIVLGQVNVERKTNEIPMFPVLCDRLSPR